jgi:hypothetical protein
MKIGKHWAMGSGFTEWHRKADTEDNPSIGFSFRGSAPNMRIHVRAGFIPLDMDNRYRAIVRASEVAAKGCMRLCVVDNGFQHQEATAKGSQCHVRAKGGDEIRQHPLQDIYYKEQDSVHKRAKLCEHEQE